MKNPSPTKGSRNTRFIALMVLAALIALGGQGLSLYTLVDFNSLKTRWEAREGHRDRIRTDLEDLESRTFEIKAAIASDEHLRKTGAEDVKKVKADLASAEENRRAEEAKTAEAGKQFDSYMAEKTLLRKKIEVLKKELRDLQQKVETKIAAGEGITKSNAILEQDKARLTQNVSDAQERHASTRAKLDADQKELVRVGAELIRLQVPLRKAEEAQSELDARNKALGDAKEEEAELKRRTASLRTQKGILLDGNSHLTDSKEVLEKSISDLKTREKELETSVQGLSRSAKDLEVKVGRLKTEEIALRPRVQKLRSEEEILNGKLTQLEANKKILNPEIADLEAQLAGLQNRRSKDQDLHIKALTDTWNAIIERIRTLEENMHKVPPPPQKTLGTNPPEEKGE